MWEILKVKVKEMPVEWVKYALIAALAMMATNYYLSFKHTVAQANFTIAQLQVQVQQQMDALNGQCQQALERQGFEVTKKPPPGLEEKAEEKLEGKDDAER